MAKLVPLVGGLLAFIPVIGVPMLASHGQARAAALAYGAVENVAGFLLLPRLMRREARIPSALG